MPSGEYECVGRSSFRLLLIEDGRNQILRHLLEMGRLHRVARSPFRKRADGGGVAEQLRQRNLGVNNCEMPPGFDAANAATTAAEVAANVTLIIFRRDVFDLHDRLEQNGVALLKAIFHGENRGQLEGQLAGIDLVKAAVNDVHFDVDNRIATEHAIQHRFFNALLNCRDVFPRNNTPNDLVFDNQTFAALAWPNVDFDVTVLTTSARLLDQFPDAMGVSSNRLAICDLRFARVGVDFEFT